MSGSKHIKEDSPTWHTAYGLDRHGLPQEAESLLGLRSNQTNS